MNEKLRELIVKNHTNALESLAEEIKRSNRRIVLWQKLLDKIDLDSFSCWFFKDESLFIETRDIEKSWELVSQITDLFSNCRVLKNFLSYEIEPTWQWRLELDHGATVLIAPAEPSETCKPKRVKHEVTYWACEPQ